MTPRPVDPNELAENIAPSTGLRNLLVHEYGRVDLGRLAEVVPTAVEQYTAYVAQVSRYVLTLTDKTSAQRRCSTK